MDLMTPAYLAFERKGPELIVAIAGELDGTTAPECAARIGELSEPGDEATWLDLRDVTACSDAGVTLIVEAHNQALERGGHVVVYRPSTCVIRALQFCLLDHRLRIRTA